MPDVPWPRIADVLGQALDAPPAERPTVLAAACRRPDGTADAALRREVEALLDAADAADAAGRLTSPVAEIVGPDDDVAPGDAVGPWRLTGLLGEGGMGVVYAAERADGLYDREVALKRLRPGPGRRRLAARLRAERRTLARLEHPGIARLYDGGVSDDGTPYLVMERVDGEPITAWARRARPSVGARVRLFAKVCDAVAYAHARLVVHRDLKPSNVFVTEHDGDPAVTLLDFGIAKLLDASDATETLGAAMTPAYAAPEQLAGGDITTATDVYALGVLLYEVLAGQRPYDVAGATAAEAERIVREAAPPPPSAVAGADAARLTGDLDVIVAKALAKEPARRYASAEALADDLRRHLGGLPVHARPATAGYRAGRFVRRHRVGVAATALVALALVAGLGAALWQAGQARDQAAKAEAEAAKAEAVNAFMAQVLTAADGAWYTDSDVAGPDVTVAAVLDAAAARLDAEPPDDPLVEAAARRAVGSAYRSLSRLDEAAAQLAQSVALYRAHAPAPSPDLAHAVHDLGHVRYFQARYAEAAALLGDARAQWAATHAAPDRWLFAYTNDAANPLNRLGRFEEAADLFQQAVAVGRAVDEVPPNAVAIAVANLVGARLQQRRYAEADSLAAEVVTLFDRAGPGYALERSATLTLVAEAARRAGRLAEADSLSRAALDGLVAAAGAQSPYAVNAAAVRAWVLVEAGRPAEAEALADRALGAADALWPTPADYHARVRHARGAARAARGDLPGAEADLRAAAGLFDRAPGAPHGAHAAVALDLADVLRRRGALAEAAGLARLAQRIARDTAPGPSDALRARADAAVRALAGS